MIITIGRQLGCGGHYISKELSKRLNIPFYDKELLFKAAQLSGLDAELFERVDENVRGKISSGLFGFRYYFVMDGVPYYGGLSGEELFKIQSDAINYLSTQGPCLILGRCADFVLRDRHDIFNIFVCGDEADRMERIAEENKISMKEARNMMIKSDKQRAIYYDFYTSKKWGYSESYHACINTSVFGIDGTVTFLEKLIQAWDEQHKVKHGL